MENVVKSFGDLEVLRGVSLAVEQGEVVSLLGPSGSGKSTLLRCATLLERMDSGTLRYLGEAAAEQQGDRTVYASAAKLARIRACFGLVFQNFNLFPHFSVLRNLIDAPVKVQGKNRDEAVETARTLLRRMGLADKEDAYPYQLSGGQQQRVAIARALALEPRVLFFDEPTSALDPELTGEVLRIIRDLAVEHMTMVIVTHEIAFARSISDRVVFLSDGVIVEQGTPAEVIDNPRHERTRTFLSTFAG